MRVAVSVGFGLSALEVLLCWSITPLWASEDLLWGLEALLWGSESVLGARYVLGWAWLFGKSDLG